MLPIPYAECGLLVAGTINPNNFQFYKLQFIY